MSRLVFTKGAAPTTPANNKAAVYIDTSDFRIKQIDSNGIISVLNNDGLQDKNILINGNFAIQQRVLAASTAIPSISVTTRAGQVADRWAVTTGNVTTTAWAQIDTAASIESGLESRYYGKITQATNAAKFILSQFIINSKMAHLRGKKVRVSVKLKQFVGSNQVYKLGLLQLNAAGTVDVCPAFSTAIGASGVNPSFAATLPNINPDVSPTGENGTVNGAYCEIISTVNWLRSSCVFTVPTDAKNLVVVLIKDATGGATDSVGIAEVQLTQGPDIVDWVSPPLAEQLLECQRYFSKSFPMTVVPAASVAVATGGFGSCGILGKAASGSALGSQIPVLFPVRLWKVPSVTLFTPITTGAVVYRHSGVTPAVQGVTAVLANSTTDIGCVVTATTEATANAVIGDLVSIHWTAEAEFLT
jgi:hypothetical protein